MRRSDCRSRFGNCVRIWYNFGVVKKVMNDLDSGRWILELAYEWNASGVSGSGRIETKCKMPRVEG